ncbi:MAG: hypothetical protein KJ060_13775 [Candidatus Hydrogenedentes bacterium]|nr:hypothetical protein [Candidatus Hydrogenedentota bacterium]
MRTYKTRASSPVLALLWENWRLTYLAFFVALILGAGVTHSIAEMHRLGTTSWGDPDLPSYAICWFALFLYGAIAMYALADPKALSPRIPARQFCLPIRTGAVVAIHLLYRLLSFVLLAAALFTLMRLEFGDLIVRPLTLDMAIAASLFSYVIAVAWSWGSVRPWIRAAIVIFAPLVVVALSIRMTDGQTFERTWMGLTLDSTGITTGLFLAAGLHAAVAYFVGLRSRLGTGPGSEQMGLGSRLLGNGPRITSSGQQAQFWYEWRKKGWVLPALTLSFTFAAVVVARILNEIEDLSDLGELLLLVPFQASLFAAFVTGLYMLSVDYRHASSGLSTFLYTRPLSTDAYTRARLRISVQSVLLNMCLCLALGLAGIILVSERGPYFLARGTGDIEDAPLYLCAIVAYGLLLWSLLWMSVPVLLYLFWLGSYFYYQSLANTEFESINEHIHMFWLIWIPAAALVAATAIVWRLPTMWRSLSDAIVARARNLMILAFVVMVTAVIISDEVDPFGPDSFEVFSILLAIVGLSTLPALSILSQPLLLNRLRRR